MTRPAGDLVALWDARAPTYDAATAGMERRFLADSRRWVCGRAFGATLDLGVGTGANLPHYPDGVDVTGVDWSLAMLAAARRRAGGAGRTVALHRADASFLPFDAETFDSVVCTYTLCCVPDERAALGEALRVLRPGGRLLLADHVVASSWLLRGVQHALDLVTVPRQGEHWSRRPVTTLAGLDVTVEETERRTLGALERVQARKPA